MLLFTPPNPQNGSMQRNKYLTCMYSKIITWMTQAIVMTNWQENRNEKIEGMRKWVVVLCSVLKKSCGEVQSIFAEINFPDTKHAVAVGTFYHCTDSIIDYLINLMTCFKSVISFYDVVLVSSLVQVHLFSLVLLLTQHLYCYCRCWCILLSFCWLAHFPYQFVVPSSFQFVYVVYVIWF